MRQLADKVKPLGSLPIARRGAELPCNDILRDGAEIMATTPLDWSQCSAVESIPGKRSGAWVFRHTRTPVSVVFDNLGVGASINEIMDWFHLSHEQVTAVIE